VGIGKIVLTKPTFLFLFLAVTGIGLTIGAAFVLGISAIEAQQAFADLIDFETGFIDKQPVGDVITATNIVTFGVGSCAAPTPAFIAETGTPTTAYVPTDDIPTGASGSFFLTDQTAAPKTTLDYCISFATPVNNLSVDLYDYRADGGASVGDVATLSVFNAGGSPVGSVTFVIPPGTPDPNLATLSIQSPTDLISSAKLSFSSPDKGTGIDNILFNIAPPPMQVYEVSGVSVIPGSNVPSELGNQVQLRCLDGDWLSPSSLPFSMTAEPIADIVANNFDIVAVQSQAIHESPQQIKASKFVGFDVTPRRNAVQQLDQLFDITVTISILCLSP